MPSKKKPGPSYPYTVTVTTYVDGSTTGARGRTDVKVSVPHDFDRVRGADDVARDLAAQRFTGDATARWIVTDGQDRGFGAIAQKNTITHTGVRMHAMPDTLSPSGCPISPDEEIAKVPTYRVVKVNDRAWNAWMGTTALGSRRKTLRDALVDLIGWNNGAMNEHWRVVEVPAGEPWDYDGVIVAEVKTGRGVA